MPITGPHSRDVMATPSPSLARCCPGHRSDPHSDPSIARLPHPRLPLQNKERWEGCYSLHVMGDVHHASSDGHAPPARTRSHRPLSPLCGSSSGLRSGLPSGGCARALRRRPQRLSRPRERPRPNKHRHDERRRSRPLRRPPPPKCPPPPLPSPPQPAPALSSSSRTGTPAQARLAPAAPESSQTTTKPRTTTTTSMVASLTPRLATSP